MRLLRGLNKSYSALRQRVHVVPVLTDNYTFIVPVDEDGKRVVIIDPALSTPVFDALNTLGKPEVAAILNTHHHFDHIGGNQELKLRTGAPILASNHAINRIPNIDRLVRGKETLILGSTHAIVLETPGHTLDHICLWFPNERWLFCGDTLFSMGCGRLFEGTPTQMWKSLTTLMELDDDTQIFCGHEYTERNATFALWLEPNNQAVVERFKEVSLKRQRCEATIPSTIGLEKATNPFLRPRSLSIRDRFLLSSEMSDDEVFAVIRKSRDHF